MTLTEIKRVLQELNLRPSRRLGQNYLYDQNLAQIIVQAAGIGPTDQVVEVGPGLGALTEILVNKTSHLHVVEIDARAAGYLQSKFPALRVHQADALKFDFPASGSWICIGNLPYSVGSRLIVRLGEPDTRPARMIFTVQREVAERLAAKTNVKDYGVLTLLVQPWYQVRIIRHLPASVFFPKPDVESSTVLFERRDCPLDGDAETRYRAMVKRAFQHRRKTLGAILGADLPKNLDPKKRPAEISVQEWIQAALRAP